MQNVFTKTILIIGVFILFVALETPIESLFVYSSFSDINKTLITGILWRLPAITCAFIAIRKFGLVKFSGINQPFKIRNIHALIVPILIFCVALHSNYEIYYNSNSLSLFLFILYVLSIGFLEEFVFRGIILPLWIKKSGNIFVAVMISSVLFGLIHYINFFTNSENINSVTSQVIVAFVIGILFSGFLIRTGSLISVALLHGMVDFIGFKHKLIQVVNRENNLDVNTKVPDLGDSVFSLIIFALIAGIGLLMIWGEGKKKVLSRF